MGFISKAKEIIGISPKPSPVQEPAPASAADVIKGIEGGKANLTPSGQSVRIVPNPQAVIPATPAPQATLTGGYSKAPSYSSGGGGGLTTNVGPPTQVSFAGGGGGTYAAVDEGGKTSYYDYGSYEKYSQAKTEADQAKVSSTSGSISALPEGYGQKMSSRSKSWGAQVHGFFGERVIPISRSVGARANTEVFSEFATGSMFAVQRPKESAIAFGGAAATTAALAFAGPEIAGGAAVLSAPFLIKGFQNSGLSFGEYVGREAPSITGAIVGGGAAGKITSRFDVPQIRAVSVNIPVLKGGVLEPTTIYSGISLERGPNAMPLVGFANKKLSFGTPKVDFSTAGFEGGYVPGSATETRIVLKNIKMPEMELGKVSDVRSVLEVTQKQPSKYLQKELLKETLSLSEKGVGETLKMSKAWDAEVYGSFAARQQMPDVLKVKRFGLERSYEVGRTPADIDIQLGVGEEKASVFAQKLNERLVNIGEPVRISKQSSTLIESKDAKGVWHHALDIHSKDSPLDYGEPSEMVFGFKLGQPSIRKEGVKLMPLSEQGIRKGYSSIKLRAEGVGPEAHRTKDIYDFVKVQEVLLASAKKSMFSKLKGNKIFGAEMALESYKKRMNIDESILQSTSVKLKVQGPRIPSQKTISLGIAAKSLGLNPSLLKGAYPGYRSPSIARSKSSFLGGSSSAYASRASSKASSPVSSSSLLSTVSKPVSKLSKPSPISPAYSIPYSSPYSPSRSSKSPGYPMLSFYSSPYSKSKKPLLPSSSIWNDRKWKFKSAGAYKFNLGPQLKGYAPSVGAVIFNIKSPWSKIKSKGLSGFEMRPVVGSTRKRSSKSKGKRGRRK